MTREDLINMVGSEEQAEYAIKILLNNVTESFIKNCIDAEVNKIKTEVDQLKEEGYIYSSNGFDEANFNKVAEHQGLQQTEEQEKAEATAREKYDRAFYLLCARNRLTSMTAIR